MIKVIDSTVEEVDNSGTYIVKLKLSLLGIITWNDYYYDYISDDKYFIFQYKRTADKFANEEIGKYHTNHKIALVYYWIVLVLTIILYFLVTMNYF